jgi:hypothetical protein
MSHKKKTIRAYADESWIYKVNIRTYDTKSYNAVPLNISTHFLLMEVYDISGNVIASAYTDGSSSALANGISGVAILNFPLSSTSGISSGLYNYNMYITDLPIRASATYVKRIMHGPFELQ